MADFKIGQLLTHTCRRTGIMPVEFRGFHQHAETGAGCPCYLPAGERATV